MKLKMLVGMVLLTPLLLANCAASRTTSGSNAPSVGSSTPKISSVVALISQQYRQGHGCPVGDRLLLTARHMNRVETAVGEKTLYLGWGDMAGNEGFLYPLSNSLALDLSAMHSPKKFPTHFTVSASTPSIGDRLFVVGFREKRFSFLEDVVIPVKMEGRRANLFFYSGNTKPGTSGSCIVNEKGEMVGIHVAGIDMTNEALGIPITPEDVASYEAERLACVALGHCPEVEK